jgi:hypothetical protein
MFEVYDEANLNSYLIRLQEVQYITKKFQSSSQAGSTFQISIMFKNSKELEMTLTDVVLGELVGALSNA